MTELLALPGWNTSPTELYAWVERIQGFGHDVVTTRESTGVSWIEVPSLRLRGYAVMQGRHVEAINFEITAPDATAARQVVEGAAAQLGWEVDEDDSDDGDDDKED
jgi:hypothetical protein